LFRANPEKVLLMKNRILHNKVFFIMYCLFVFLLMQSYCSRETIVSIEINNKYIHKDRGWKKLNPTDRTSFIEIFNNRKNLGSLGSPDALFAGANPYFNVRVKYANGKIEQMDLRKDLLLYKGVINKLEKDLTTLFLEYFIGSQDNK
jgi:hypothetical protein